MLSGVEDYLQQSGLQPQYAVARDGRFLVNQPVADATAAPITLILNWNHEAKK